MTLELLTALLGWSTLLNFGLLILWAAFLVLLPNYTYRLQTRWMSIPRDDFNRIHFLLFGVYKLCIIFFNVIPYLVLQIIL